ncbi:phosphatidylinositol transfer protein alpha isoform-like [Rhopilema esculentum]|uniref:phosphatidylinositol transfer protein alpha isoform-like n=1 Tax=Rhopilema esculentum TaxID=499914 RepID=UPI0031E01444|eukprot:gene5162-293_t
MSIIREYRIPLPLTVEEYRIAQLYSVAEASKNENGGGDGVEIVQNEPYTNDPEHGGSGQYTLKMMHIENKVPALIRNLAPNGSLVLEERSWNSFPYCTTVYTNSYMKERFKIEIISWYKEERVSKNDNSNKHHTLTESESAKRVVEFIDIVNDPVDPTDYKVEEDPTKFKSTKTGRGPLGGTEWYSNCESYMCCYKLYKVNFEWFQLQSKVQSLILKVVRRLLLNFHRQVFCWLDKWHGLSIEDIREIEEKTKHELDQQRNSEGMCEH